MTKYFKIGLFCLQIFASVAVYADDGGTVVEGDENYTPAECIDTNTNKCLEEVCMNSTDTNCDTECRASAENACKNTDATGH